MAFDGDGTPVGTVFETAAPFETPRLMAELVECTNAALDDQDAHPLVAIGVFAAVFLAIHPFQDGNGRLSRILTTLLLLRAGYAFVPYSSLEAVIERTKPEYYLALRRTQSSLRTPSQDWQPWLEYFLWAMAEQVAQLERRLARDELALGPLAPLSEAILRHARERGRITMGEAIRLTGAKRPTLKAHFAKLVERGSLVRTESAREVGTRRRRGLGRRRRAIWFGDSGADGYHSAMDELPARRQGWPIEVHPLHDRDAAQREREYWLSRPPAERMEALDRLREERDGPQPRLARVARVIERKRG